MKDITFINIYDHLKPDVFEPPVGLVSLKTILDSNGYNVEIVDFQYLFYKGLFPFYHDTKKYVDKMKSYIISRNPRLISFYTMCNNVHIIIYLIEELKKSNPNLIMGMGGPHATLAANSIMEQFKSVDFIGLGEGELSICGIVDALHNLDHVYPNKVKGLVYRHNNRIISGEMPDLIKNLNQLPILNYDEFDIVGIKNLPIDVGRGCPYQCAFCSTNIFWKRKYRLKSPERIVKELVFYNSKFSINNFSFMHDMFTANRSKIMEFCKLIKDENLDVNWNCSARIESLDNDLVTEMISAGCEGVFIGIETGSPKMQRIINKNIDLPSAFSKIYQFSRQGLHMIISFIYGFPEETEKDLNDTIEYIYKLVKYVPALAGHIQLHKLCFFSGTELTNKYLSQLIYEKNPNNTMLHNNERLLPSRRLSKEVFTHFYELPYGVCKHFNQLDKFIVFVVIKTMKTYTSTYDMLQMTNISWTELYRHLINDVDVSSFLDASSFFKTADKTDLQAIGSIKSFHNAILNSTFDDRIKSICDVEFKTAEFLYFSDSKTIEVNIGFDFIEYRNAKIWRPGEFLLLLERKTNEKISVRQIKND